MRRVKVRHRSSRIGRKRVDEASAGCADVDTGTPAETGCRGRDVDRFGIRVIKIELEPIAELLSQSGLEGVVVRFPDGTPGERARRLVVQIIATLSSWPSASRLEAGSVSEWGAPPVVP